MRRSDLRFKDTASEFSQLMNEVGASSTPPTIADPKIANSNNGNTSASTATSRNNFTTTSTTSKPIFASSLFNLSEKTRQILAETDQQLPPSLSSLPPRTANSNSNQRVNLTPMNENDLRSQQQQQQQQQQQPRFQGHLGFLAGNDNRYYFSPSNIQDHSQQRESSISNSSSSLSDSRSPASITSIFSSTRTSRHRLGQVPPLAPQNQEVQQQQQQQNDSKQQQQRCEEQNHSSGENYEISVPRSTNDEAEESIGNNNRFIVSPSPIYRPSSRKVPSASVNGVTGHQLTFDSDDHDAISENNNSTNNNMLPKKSSATASTSSRPASGASTARTSRPSSAVDRLKQMIEQSETDNEERKKKRNKLLEQVEETRRDWECQGKILPASTATESTVEVNSNHPDDVEEKKHSYVSVESGSEIDHVPAAENLTSASAKENRIGQENPEEDELEQLKNRNWEAERNQAQILRQQEQEHELAAFLEQRKLAEAFTSLSWDERVERADIELKERIDFQEVNETIYDILQIMRQASEMEALEQSEREQISSQWEEQIFASMASPFLQTVEKRFRDEISSQVQVIYTKLHRLMMYEEKVVDLSVEESYAREEIYVDWEDELPEICDFFTVDATEALSRELWMAEVDEANGRGDIENDLTEFFMLATEGQRWSKPVVEMRAAATVRARQEWRQHIALLKSEVVEMEGASRMLIQKEAITALRDMYYDEKNTRQELEKTEEESSIQRAIREAQQFAEKVGNDEDDELGLNRASPLPLKNLNVKNGNIGIRSKLISGNSRKPGSTFIGKSASTAVASASTPKPRSKANISTRSASQTPNSSTTVKRK